MPRRDHHPGPAIAKPSAETSQLCHKQMDGLTGLRAVAALWVVAFHVSVGPFVALHLDRMLPPVRLGYLGVDLFFMLSGFVIWHVHARDFRRPAPAIFKRFVLLRLARLYPVYLFTLLLLTGLLVLYRYGGTALLNPDDFRPGDFRLHQLLADLAMVQTWGLTDQLHWNYPAWSISAEWFCYLFFPLAALLFPWLGRRGAAAAVAVLLAALALIYFVPFERSMDQAVGPPALARALIEFLIGCLLRRIAEVAPVERMRWSGPFLVLAALVVGASALDGDLAGFLPVVLFPVLILAASNRANLIGRIAGSRPLVLIGAASYSLYLMQAPVQKGAQWLVQAVDASTPVVTALAILGYLAVLAGSTALVYRLVETPARRILRRRLARTSRPPRQEPALQPAARGAGGR